MEYKETPSTTSYGEKNQEKHLEQPGPVNWQNTVGKTIMSKDNLDMGKVIVDPDTDYNTSYFINIEYGDHERLGFQKRPFIK
jgi:hypothetical protein